ncbi:MAG: hypothetical protein H6672_12025 [Anaerolineaceae bacterium]|nr:hypothetical protein [Anaerolineaceae bacterium]
MIAEKSPPTNLKIKRLLENYSEDVDRRLPDWARRSNPIIQRHLGRYWKTLLPEPIFLLKVILVEVAFIILTLPFPFLFDLTLPAITASILLFPVAMYSYARLLLAVGSSAATSIVIETRNDTITLLRTIPVPLTNILASKVSASIWRQVEDLAILIIAATVLGLPLIISHYATAFPLSDYPAISRIAMILGTVVAMIRLILEPFMIGAIGLMMGAALPVRSSAVISTALVGFFYFLMLNMLRMLPLTWPMRYIVDFFLPVVLPLLITWVGFRVTEYLLTRD